MTLAPELYGAAVEPCQQVVTADEELMPLTAIRDNAARSEGPTEAYMRKALDLEEGQKETGEKKTLTSEFGVSVPKRRRCCLCWLFSVVLIAVSFHFYTAGGPSCEWKEWEHKEHFWRNCFVGTANTASIYFRSQRSQFQAAAKDYSLHWAFAQGSKLDTAAIKYDIMVAWRFEAMVRNLKLYGRDDSMVEKNKCVMYRFFARNRIKFAPILYDSLGRGKDVLMQDAKSKKLFANVSSWPVFLKSCHLTMGGADGVLRIKNVTNTDQRWVLDSETMHRHIKVQDIAGWLSAKWEMPALDKGRPWEESADILSEHLKPNFILQGPAQLSYVKKTGKHVMFEIKVYVLWGRAFLGMVISDQKKPESIDNTLVIRGRNDLDMELIPKEGLGSIFYLHRFRTHDEGRHLQWLVDEHHGDCVWPLAGLAAQRMKIDEVRIDIFVTMGKPRECMVNEISLSSGFGQAAFRPYMGKLWAEYHVKRSYKIWGSARSKPVYMLNMSDQ